MRKVLNILFSMQFAAVLLLVFAAAIGTATIIENDFGTIAAREMVYNALWFEILLLVLSISMMGSIFKYKLYQRKKFTVLLFHISFVVILIGAAITRYIGYEGTMSIREGKTSNEIVSLDTYIQIKANDGNEEVYYKDMVNFNAYKNNHYKRSHKVGGESFRLSFKEYIPNAAKTIMDIPNGKPIASLTTGGMSGRENFFVEDGQTFNAGGLTFTLNKEAEGEFYVNMNSRNDSLFFVTNLPATVMNMMAGTTDTLEAGKEYDFKPMNLYKFGEHGIVLRRFFASATTKLISSPPQDGFATSDAIVMDLRYKGETKEVTVLGAKNIIGEFFETEVAGTKFYVAYGSKIIKIPFALKLRDFQLERYPGSMSPSSFASEVTLIDERVGLEEERRIFMNNVLNYEGFRFFQSSYDKDELGTILSVNKDAAGTVVTYIGYFIMTLGMVLNFFSRNSRFHWLLQNSKKLKQQSGGLAIAFLVSVSFMLPEGVQAQQAMDPHTRGHIHIDSKHAKEFGSLLILDTKGRVKPINTLASEVLRKVSRKASLDGHSAEQILLGMMIDPAGWQGRPMIKVSDDGVKRLIGINGKYASFNDFIDMQNNFRYKLSGYVDEAYNKKPAERNSFDKDVIKVDERVNIVYMVYTGSLLKIFPKPGDENNSWFTVNDSLLFEGEERMFVKGIMPLYTQSIVDAASTGDWSVADEYLGYIKTFQTEFGAEILPPKFKTDLEIMYNKYDVFKRLFPYFFLVGFVLLIVLFIKVLNPERNFRLIVNIGIALVILGFVFQTLGLAARWYIAEHAPWSNGYETMIYISWATVLSGIIYMRKSQITTAVTAILAAVTLMVANLSWLDPEITNLVPVLKSYWLVIHVAIITASYSFLAIGALLGFTNLMMMIFKNTKNEKRIDHTIKELTNINEQNLIIGGFLITIGTFLGAVWANESWGRYWGWDPKETWALVTVIVYAFIVHMRLTPGLRGEYAFNFTALIGFGSVLMTYFGVNYYLSGMHSYAAGDPVPIPTFVYYTVAIIALVSIVAYIRYDKFEKSKLKKE